MKSILNLEAVDALAAKRKPLDEQLAAALGRTPLYSAQQAVQNASAAVKAAWDSLVAAEMEGHAGELPALRKKLQAAETSAAEAKRNLEIADAVDRQRTAGAEPLRDQVLALDIEIALATFTALSEEHAVAREAQQRALQALKEANAHVLAVEHQAADLSVQGLELATWRRNHLDVDYKLVDQAAQSAYEHRVRTEIRAAGYRDVPADKLDYLLARAAFRSSLPASEAWVDPFAEHNARVAAERAAAKTDATITQENSGPVRIHEPVEFNMVGAMRERDPYEPGAETIYRSWDKPSWAPGGELDVRR